MSNDYYKSPESVEEYIKLAQSVNGSQLIEKLKRFLPSGSFVVEIGSGPGTDWDILNEDYDVVGSDNSTEFLNRLKLNKPEGEFLELDASTLVTEKKFDAIYSNKVLHHLKDAELRASIQRQYDILNEGGIICHSFWKGEGSEIFNGLFVNYHTTQNIKSLFEGYFEILLIEEYMEFEKSDSLLLIAKKQ